MVSTFLIRINLTQKSINFTPININEIQATISKKLFNRYPPSIKITTLASVRNYCKSSHRSFSFHNSGRSSECFSHRQMPTHSIGFAIEAHSDSLAGLDSDFAALLAADSAADFQLDSPHAYSASFHSQHSSPSSYPSYLKQCCHL